MSTVQAQDIEIVKLVPPPRPTKENIIGFNFGIRPYRVGGVRLERQLYKNKIFYHNYGHGGAGVSLAYGCSEYIVQMFTKEVGLDSAKEVAVIGAGYMGLMQSIMLSELGFKVTVYTKNFPKELGVYDEGPCITSQVAGGLWMPFGLDIKDKALHLSLAKKTYEYYKECIEKKKYQGLSFKPMYTTNLKSQFDEFCPPGLIKPRRVKVDFGNEIYHDAVTYVTIMMDGDRFLNELYLEAREKGVNFVSRNFEDILDLCELKEKYVFNCTGTGSRILFNDINIIPIVGHMLYLKKEDGVDYFLSSSTEDGSMAVTMYPQSNKLAIGLTYEERGWLDKPDMNMVKRLIQNLEKFLELRTRAQVQPKL